ncbi:MAG: PaaI family thioesterase [Cycloclasticus sp.]
MKNSKPAVNPLLCKVNQTPHATILKLELVSAKDDTVTLKLPFSEHIIGDPFKRLIHGGAITTLMDTVCGAAVFQAQGNFQSMATLDLRVDHMRPADSGLDVFAIAECYRLTNTVAFIRATAYTDNIDEPVATAVASFMRSNVEFPVQ